MQEIYYKQTSKIFINNSISNEIVRSGSDFLSLWRYKHIRAEQILQLE